MPFHQLNTSSSFRVILISIMGTPRPSNYLMSTTRYLGSKNQLTCTPMSAIEISSS